MHTHTVPKLLGTLIYLVAVGTSYGHDGHSHDDGHSHEHGVSHEHVHADGTSHQHSHATEMLAYRLTDWNSLQFSDPRLAQQHLEAVRGLGCEAHMDDVPGSLSVSYRCIEWKPMEVATHELAEQWATWLVAAGFDCSHGHVDPVMLNGPEIVEYRLAEWQTAHVQPEEMTLFVESLNKIGCEVHQSNDGDHVDVNFRSPLWRDIHLGNHQTAEQWVAFFEEHAFEVRHEH